MCHSTSVTSSLIKGVLAWVQIWIDSIILNDICYKIWLVQALKIF